MTWGCGCPHCGSEARQHDDAMCARIAALTRRVEALERSAGKPPPFEGAGDPPNSGGAIGGTGTMVHGEHLGLTLR